jgi:hypothetical protein
MLIPVVGAGAVAFDQQVADVAELDRAPLAKPSSARYSTSGSCTAVLPFRLPGSRMQKARPLLLYPLANAYHMLAAGDLTTGNS